MSFTLCTTLKNASNTWNFTQMEQSQISEKKKKTQRGASNFTNQTAGWNMLQHVEIINKAKTWNSSYVKTPNRRDCGLGVGDPKILCLLFLAVHAVGLQLRNLFVPLLLTSLFLSCLVSEIKSSMLISSKIDLDM